MMNDAALLLQIEGAIGQPQARYILTATVEGSEYDVGETVIGPNSDIALTKAALLTLVATRLSQVPLSEQQIAQASIHIADVPLLY